MTIVLPSLPIPAVSFSLTSYVIDFERAQDLKTLDLHHERLGAYLAALRDVEALPREDLRKLHEVFATLYRQRFAYLGSQGAL